MLRTSFRICKPRISFACRQFTSKAESSSKSGGGLRKLLVLGGAGAVGTYVVTQDADLAWSVAKPILHSCDPETAHRLCILGPSLGLFPRDNVADAPSLKTNVWGIEFENPIGLAAGFDKDGECASQMCEMGFGFVEVGSVTPMPQPGNPKPRMFRLEEDQGVINRYGFNSCGIDQVRKNIEGNWPADKGPGAGGRHGVLGINLGKNKESTDAAWDYCRGLSTLGTLEQIKYIVVNVSSPNTPGLRKLQGRQQLWDLLSAVKAQRDLLDREPKPPLLVKIAPDLTEDDKKDIAAVVTGLGIDGLIVSNTTISRPESLKGKFKDQTGGLSGTPVRALADAALRDMYKETKGKVTLIGVGGVSSGEDAYRKIRLGASLVQVYSNLAYEGPPMVRRVKDELAELLARDGFGSVADAVGADHRPPKKK